MDWTRYRTMGLDLLIVGVLVLVVASALAFYPACSSPGVCHTAVDLATLSPGLTLLAAGVVLTVMSRRRKPKAG